MIMSFPSRILGQLSNVFAWLGTMAFLVMLIAIPIGAGDRHNTVKQITESYNQTLWSNGGLVFLLTFLTPSWVISGYDSTG
jgi:hypothetical protein